MRGGSLWERQCSIQTSDSHRIVSEDPIPTIVCIQASLYRYCAKAKKQLLGQYIHTGFPVSILMLGLQSSFSGITSYPIQDVP